VFLDIRKNPNLVPPTITNLQLVSKTPDLSRNLKITEQDDDATSKMKMETTFQVSDFLSVDTSQVRGMQNTNNTADKQSNASLPQKQSAFKVQDQLEANNTMDQGNTPRVADLIHSSSIMSSNRKLNEPKFDINNAL
jgi:hypothetical protein